MLSEVCPTHFGKCIVPATETGSIPSASRLMHAIMVDQIEPDRICRWKPWLWAVQC